MIGNLSSFASFKDIFEQLDDEFLVNLYITNPRAMYNMCNMLALDLQMEKEIAESEPSTVN
jgi:hypothetical protein